MIKDLEKEIVKCRCGKWTVGKLFHIEGFDVRGSECPGCGESYLNGEDAARLSEFRKVKDAILEGKIAMAGNSYIVRLPIDVVRALGLEKGDRVKLSVPNPKEIVICV